MAEKNGNEKTKVIEKERITNEAVSEKGTTRIYDVPVKETIIVSKHRWISDEDEDVIKPVGRNTIARGDTRVYGQPVQETRVYGQPLQETRVYGQPLQETRLYGQPLQDTRAYGQSLQETRVYGKPQPETQGAEEDRAAGKSLREAAGEGAARLRGIYTDLRNVRVSDSTKFARFLKVIGVFTLILLLEIGYFAFAHRTERLPGDIKAAKEELELTKKESVILQEEIDELGGYDNAEEQRQSWERLKEKVEKAEAETSS